MPNSKKFKFPYNTRSSQQVSNEYKDIVHRFMKNDAASKTGNIMKRKNLQAYRVMQNGFIVKSPLIPCSTV